MTTELTDSAEHTTAQERAPRVLLYGTNVDTRASVLLAVGPRLKRGAPAIDWVQTATHAAVLDHADAGGFDLFVLDGEAAKSGGMGLCRQLKDELFQCPPILVLTARPQDSWLASWSLADAVVSQPFDPIELQSVIARLLASPPSA
ncbi:hypothetical protein [Pengzhenrongella sp.]|jgi:DNA-binding response OmpR family regulator|uniref:hypothetical protein n=1 Tax=Pengzhenrongella sp. TaxID=2888820 RepID=UPI002F9343B9